MLIPVRCFSCNTVISSKWNMYSFLKKEGMEPSDIFEKLKIKRYCCKRMLLSHKDFIDSMLEHEQDYDYVKIY